MIVIGKNELEQGNISIRKRNGEKLDNIQLSKFIDILNNEIKEDLCR